MCTPFRLLGAGIVIPGSLCQLRQASLVFSLAWMGGKVRHTAAVLSGNKTVAAVSSVYGPATLCFAGDTGEAAREGICRHVLGPDAVFSRELIGLSLCHVRVYSVASMEAVPDIGKP